MVYLGVLLMIYNIYEFVRFDRYIRQMKTWDSTSGTLTLPIALLICFLLGYIAVALYGKPDIIIASILFGGSIFVYTMYRQLSGVVQKVVEREHLEAELLAAEESNRTKNRFLASMSHEMRTPMNVIIGMDEIALQDDSLKPQTRERLRKIDVSAHHLLDIINAVLNMNYLESSDMQLTTEPFSLRGVLELVNTLSRSQCEEKRINYVVEVDPAADIICVGDSLRVRQVLVNVIDNAIKFTPAEGKIRFSTELVSCDGAENLLRFTVSDNGIGIDESYIPRMFEPFSQEDASTTNRYGGSGLGLAITKKLVDLMGGSIAVESKKGEGSTFVITLKLGVCAEEAPPAEDADRAVSLAGRHILIAEDMDLNAEMVADLLEMEDMTSERAENGQAAVDMFSQSPEGRFDAVLMDLRMPVMDGLNAARGIRALDRGDAGTVPIIALTANTSGEDVRQSLEAGMNAHMSKPVDADKLYETLRELVR